MALWKRRSAEPDKSDKSDPVLPTARNPRDTSSRSVSAMFLSGNTSTDRESVAVLLDTIAQVSASRDLESLLDYVVDAAVKTTNAERGLLVLVDEEGKQQVRVARTRAGEALAEGERYSTSSVKRVVEKYEPLRTTVSADSKDLDLGASVYDLKLRAVMCVPLGSNAEASQTPETTSAGGNHRGALYVDSKAATREFTDENLALFNALAHHIGIALENARLSLQAVEKARLENALELATEIQSGLMPKEPKSLPGFDVFGWFLPAEHATGDFYDFVATKDGRLAVVVGDVTGHGIGPALITASAQAGLRSYAKVLPDPAAMVTLLNQDLTERMDDGMFLTLCLATLQEDGCVQFVNAGHADPLIWRAATSTIESAPSKAPAIGFMDNFEYETGGEFQLLPGDILLMFTDGLLEARHPANPDRLFEESGVRAVFSDVGYSGGGSKVLCEQLAEAVLDFTAGKREDDMTIVAVRREPEA
jgi:phosphoserine phosphatase RsbU/P